MTRGYHIANILIKIREDESNRKHLKTIKPLQQMITTEKTYFDPNKIYGGLGGFGKALVYWFIWEQGSLF